MENEIGNTNSYIRQQPRDTHPTPGVAAEGETQRPNPASPGLGHDPRRADGEALNLLLANRLLSALPTEEFARLFPHLEPVSLAAGEVLYKLDEEMRYAYFPETAVVSH